MFQIRYANAPGGALGAHHLSRPFTEAGDIRDAFMCVAIILRRPLPLFEY